MVKIKELPVSERPYERLAEYGVENLTNEELLAILIKTGTSKISAKELATQILSKIHNISELNNLIAGSTDSVITLGKNYTFVSGTDDAYATGILINRNVEIIGNGYIPNKSEM